MEKILKKMVKKFPNDYELGNKIREMINSYEFSCLMDMSFDRRGHDDEGEFLNKIIKKFDL